MNLFQGANASLWVWASVFLAVATCLATWYFTIIGVDTSLRKQKRGERTVEHYGDIEEDRAPVPKFLMWTYVIVGLWVAGYIIITGLYGIGT